MTPSTPTVHGVLRALFGGCDGLLNLRARYTTHTTSSHYRLDDPVGIRAFLNNHALGADCYIGMATYVDDSSAQADNALHLPALFVDLDFRDASEADVRQRLGAFLYPPSLVWHSGGGLQPLWLLTEPFDLRVPDEVQRATTLLRRLAQHLQADLAAAEANRVLRVVRTYNRKPEHIPPKRVELEVFEPHRRYNPSEFDQILPADTDAAPIGTAAPLPSVVKKGTRNHQLFRLGRSLRRKELVPGAIWAALAEANRTICDPPLDDREVKRLFDSVMKCKDKKTFRPPAPSLLESPVPAADAAPPALEASPAVEMPPTQEAPRLNEPAPPDLAELLDSTAAYIRRFVVVSEHQATELALWTAHTFTFQAAECTPYQHVTAGTKRAGKTLLLEVLEQIVATPWLTGRCTAAALARKVDKVKPVLLLDESDQALKESSEYSSALIGILNSGYKRSGTVSLCHGEGAGLQVVDFHTYCPKAIAGIGKLPDTIADRSIQIKLRRRTREEPIERARARSILGAAKPLRIQWQAWAAEAARVLQGASPTLPEALDDRAQDVWESLLAIADLAGDRWAKRARAAAVALSGSRDDDDYGTQLLADIRRVMEAAVVKDERGAAYDVVSSTALLKQLNKLSEAPWPTWSRGQAMTPHALAQLLAAFDLHSAKHQVAGTAKRGYRRDALEPLFARYLGIEVSKCPAPNENGPEPSFSKRPEADAADTSKKAETSITTAPADTWTLRSPGTFVLTPAVPLEQLIGALRAGKERDNGHRLTATDLDAPPILHPQPSKSE